VGVEAAAGVLDVVGAALEQPRFRVPFSAHVPDPNRRKVVPGIPVIVNGWLYTTNGETLRAYAPVAPVS
jgi:hypothetical protein